MLNRRVLVADDHAIVGEGLCKVLEGYCEIIGIVNDGNALVDLARQLQPDVIITDLSMPNLTGLEAMRQLKKENLKSRFVFLTMHTDPHIVREALQAGASGYLPKMSAGEELLTALEEVLKGHTYLSPTLTNEVLLDYYGSRKQQDRKLTSRQRQVLRHIADGRSMKEIAGILRISSRTVETYKYEMMESLGIKTTAQLIRYAIQNALDI
jgi:DNA-binding NarL/FixJ family response regulator